MFEYGDPRITVINRRRDGTLIDIYEGMKIPYNDQTAVAYQIIWDVATRIAQEQAQGKEYISVQKGG